MIFPPCVSIGTGARFEIQRQRVWDPEASFLLPLAHPLPEVMDIARANHPEVGRAAGPLASVTKLHEANSPRPWGVAFRTGTHDSASPGLGRAGLGPGHMPGPGRLPVSPWSSSHPPAASADTFPRRWQRKHTRQGCPFHLILFVRARPGLENCILL